jgi:DNA-binding transcriptional ArsR family regulator
LLGQNSQIDDLVVDVAAGSGLALLVALADASRSGAARDYPDALSGALARVGDGAGETWLNLFGVALDAGPPYTAERLAAALGTIDPVELRRHLLGRYAWSWCTLAGTTDIEAAAAGDASAAERLLAHPRYYGGHARESLQMLMPLDPRETRERIRAAVVAAVHVLLGPDVEDTLESVERAAVDLLADVPPLDVLEHLANGFRYVPEIEAERVLLVPHLDPGVGLVLAQHRGARLVVYPAVRDSSAAARLLALGRALADPTRIDILTTLGSGAAPASEIVARTGLSRSTVHYHLSQLREAGLVALEGNARAYRYAVRRDAAGAAASLLEAVVGREEAR